MLFCVIRLRNRSEKTSPSNGHQPNSERESRRSYYETPEDWLCRKETLQEIMMALGRCTEIQRQRFLLFALEGFSCTQIGNICGCSKSDIMRSIEAVRRKAKFALQTE